MATLFDEAGVEVTVRRVNIAFHASGNERCDGVAALKSNDTDVDTVTLVQKCC